LKTKWTGLAATLLAAMTLTACESGPNLGGPAAPEASITAPAANSAQLAKVQIAPVIGAPDNVSRELQSQLSAGLARNQISVAPTADSPGEYVIRGYIVAARETAGTKVSYIWDVTDRSGTRAHRVTGEETAPGRSADPWASVTPAVLQTIADKTTSQLVAWLPKSSASVPMAAAPSAASGAATLQQTAATTTAVPTQTTGSIGLTGPATTLVPAVTGAPGDGSQSLTSAIQRELARNGVTLARDASTQPYRVQGQVAMGEAKDGKQQIQIDWNVVDPGGKKLGTVSQKNEVPLGSLDGAWGKTADAAAAAAAQGIIKLLPPNKAAN
jgi:hypothetical protein